MTRKGDLSSHQIYGDIDSRVTADFVTSLLIGALIGVVGPAVANQWSLIVVYWVAERT